MTMAIKSGFDFPSDFGFSGSAGKVKVSPHMRTKAMHKARGGHVEPDGDECDTKAKGGAVSHKPPQSGRGIRTAVPGKPPVPAGRPFTDKQLTPGGHFKRGGKAVHKAKGGIAQMSSMVDGDGGGRSTGNMGRMGVPRRK